MKIKIPCLIFLIVGLAAFEVQAINAPRLDGGTLMDGQVTLNFAADPGITNLNVYRDDQYLTTINLGVPDTQVDFPGGAGEYCVVGVAPVSEGNEFSICSNRVRIDGTSESASLSAPSGIIARRYSATAGELIWDAQADVARYQVFRDGQLRDIRNGRSYFDDSLLANRSYRYEVFAVANDGQISAAASVVVPAFDVGSGSGTDLLPPSGLTAFRYSATAGELLWNSSASAGVRGYQVYRDGVLLAERDGRSFFANDLSSDRAYQYQVLAITMSGEVSDAVSVTMDAFSDNVPDPQSSSFSLLTSNARMTLLEGGAALNMGLSISRVSGHSRVINLLTEFADAADSRNLTVRLQKQALSAGENSTNLSIRLGLGVAPILLQERELVVVASDGVDTVRQRVILDVKPVEAPDVYLLIGQSNMVGYSEEGSKDAGPGGLDEPNERIRQLNVLPNSRIVFQTAADFTDESVNTMDERYILAEDPLHEPRAPWERRKLAARVGLGLTFAKYLLPHTTREIFLVPAAWSASGFCKSDVWGESWNAYGTSNPQLGGSLMLDRALTRLNMTLRDTGGVFRGILWHQGEADSNTDSCAYSYQQNLVAMVKRIKREARVDQRGESARDDNATIPFVLATMSRGNDERGNFAWFGATTKFEVDRVHRTVADHIPWSDVAYADDLVPPQYPCGIGSCVHFGAAAYRELGYRYYLSLQRILSQNDQL